MVKVFPVLEHLRFSVDPGRYALFLKSVPHGLLAARLTDHGILRGHATIKVVFEDPCQSASVKMGIFCASARESRQHTTVEGVEHYHNCSQELSPIE